MSILWFISFQIESNAYLDGESDKSGWPSLGSQTLMNGFEKNNLSLG